MGRNFIYFECVEASVSANLRLFCSSAGFNPVMPYATFLDAFNELARKEGDVVVVIDEYQNLHLKEEDVSIDSLMQVAIDQCPPGMKIILCGSYVTAMKKLLKEENPLFGRFDPVIHLESMDYLDSALFYPDVPTREKIEYYSVFGGCPYINDSLDLDAGLRSNIMKLILAQDSKARNYVEHLLFKELKKMDGINEILAILANGKKSYSEIQSNLGSRSNGYAAERLSILEDMGVVSKRAPINDPGNKKKTRYEINDNLLRFYYAYVYSNKSALQNIGEDLFYESYVRPSLDTFISYRFEAMARNYLMRRATAEKSTSVLDIGTYWYDDVQTKSNGEFDCVIRFKDHYAVYEVKHYSTPMTLAEIEVEADKIRRIRELSPVEIGFVCSCGFESRPEGYDYITADDMYAV